MARIIAFIDTYQKPSKRVDASLDTCTAERIKQNRKNSIIDYKMADLLWSASNLFCWSKRR